MKTLYKTMTCVAVAGILGGCSNSSSSDDDPISGGTPPVSQPSFASFAEIVVDASAMQDAYTDADGNLLTGITPASAGDIPDTGVVTYDGFIAGDVGGSALIGQLSLEANLGVSTTASTATNFFHETNGAYTGSLTGPGIIAQNAPIGTSQVTATLEGTLANAGTDYVTSIALEGDIIANGADPVGAVAGFADGTVGAEFFEGVFAAER